MREIVTVQCHTVLVDWIPETKKYGEMAIKAGEEVGIRCRLDVFDGRQVMVRYPAAEEWIFGWKGYPPRDQAVV